MLRKILIIKQPSEKQFLKMKKVVKVKCKIFGPLDVSALLRRRLVKYLKFFFFRYLLVFTFLGGSGWIIYDIVMVSKFKQLCLESQKSQFTFYDKQKILDP